jgi:hypothetical protein
LSLAKCQRTQFKFFSADIEYFSGHTISDLFSLKKRRR